MLTILGSVGMLVFMVRIASRGASISVPPFPMIKMITQALFPKKELPARRIVGELDLGNLRARIVRDPVTLVTADFWVFLDLYDQYEKTWQSFGLLRCDRLETQIEMLRQVSDYLAKRMPALESAVN